MIAHGSNVNAQDQKGKTPLHYPIDDGANPFLVDHKNRTPKWIMENENLVVQFQNLITFYEMDDIKIPKYD